MALKKTSATFRTANTPDGYVWQHTGVNLTPKGVADFIGSQDTCLGPNRHPETGEFDPDLAEAGGAGVYKLVPFNH